jgi:hypothetical protein
VAHSRGEAGVDFAAVIANFGNNLGDRFDRGDNGSRRTDDRGRGWRGADFEGMMQDVKQDLYNIMHYLLKIGGVVG